MKLLIIGYMSIWYLVKSWNIAENQTLVIISYVILSYIVSEQSSAAEAEKRKEYFTQHFYEVFVSYRNVKHYDV